MMIVMKMRTNKMMIMRKKILKDIHLVVLHPKERVK